MIIKTAETDERGKAILHNVFTHQKGTADKILRFRQSRFKNARLQKALVAIDLHHTTTK